MTWKIVAVTQYGEEEIETDVETEEEAEYLLEEYRLAYGPGIAVGKRREA